MNYPNLNKVGIFIQARSNSKRLPNKIYLNLGKTNQKKPLLLHVYDRLSKICNKAQVVILIPEDDRELINFCEDYNLNFFKGPHDDVRKRYRMAAEHYKVDYIIRATADNPCVDPRIVFESLRTFLQFLPDLFSFSNLPLGTGVEIFTTSALMVNTLFEEKYNMEHVSIHIKHNPHIFNVLNVPYLYRSGLLNIDTLTPKIRVTLDTKEDYEVIQNIFSILDSNFSLEDLLKIHKHYPEIFLPNQSIEQIKIPSQNIVKLYTNVDDKIKAFAS